MKNRNYNRLLVLIAILCLCLAGTSFAAAENMLETVSADVKSESFLRDPSKIIEGEEPETVVAQTAKELVKIIGEKTENTLEIEITNETGKDISFFSVVKYDPDSMTRNSIIKIQEALIEQGYLDDVADGSAGPKTQAAIVSFREANGMTKDGGTDAQMLEKLLGSGYDGNMLLDGDVFKAGEKRILYVVSDKKRAAVKGENAETLPKEAGEKTGEGIVEEKTGEESAEETGEEIAGEIAGEIVGEIAEEIAGEIAEEKVGEEVGEEAGEAAEKTEGNDETQAYIVPGTDIEINYVIRFAEKDVDQIYTLLVFPADVIKNASLCIKDNVAYLRYNVEGSDKAISTLDPEKAVADYLIIDLKIDTNNSNVEPEYVEPIYEEPADDEPEDDEPEDDDPIDDESEDDESEGDTLKDDEPSYDDPSYYDPVFDEPSYDEPQYDEPSYDEPQYDEPSYDEPQYDEQSYDEPQYDEPSYDEPYYDEPSYDEPYYDEPSYDEPYYDEPSYDEPYYDEPSYDEQFYDDTYYDESYDE